MRSHEAKLQLVRREFRKRYARWAFTDARREVSEDFPLVRCVKNQLVYRFLEMIEPLNQRDRLEVVAALVRRFHSGGLMPSTRSFVTKDRDLVDRYLEYDHGEIIPGVRARLPIWRDGEEKRLLTPQNPYRLDNVNRKRLKAAIIERLRLVCGGTVTSYDARSFFFQTPVGPWIVRTEVSTGSKFRHFSYFNRITIPSKDAIIGELSLLHSLGIGGQTYWQLRGDHEIEESVGSLADICAHFFRNAGDILQGLRPPV